MNFPRNYYFKLIWIFEYTRMQSFWGALVGACFVWWGGLVGEHLYCSVTSIKLHGGFVGVTLCHGCSPVDLLRIFWGAFSWEHLWRATSAYWILIIYIFFHQHIQHIICEYLSISILFIAVYFKSFMIRLLVFYKFYSLIALQKKYIWLCIYVHAHMHILYAHICTPMHAYVCVCVWVYIYIYMF